MMDTEYPTEPTRRLIYRSLTGITLAITAALSAPVAADIDLSRVPWDIHEGLPPASDQDYLHHWQFRYARWDSFQAGFETSATRATVQLVYSGRTPQSAYQFGYEHQPLRIRFGDPAHNGYLHQLDGEWQQTWGDWQLELGGGLHATSNMFRYGRFHREALVLRPGILYKTPLPILDQIGAGGDYRFGHFRLYPRLVHTLDLGASGQLTLDLPRMISWREQYGRLELRLERYGNKWGALDRERELKSAIYLQEWRMTGSFRHTLGGGLFLQLDSGVSFDGRLQYINLDQEQQRLNLDWSPFTALSLGAEW